MKKLTTLALSATLFTFGGNANAQVVGGNSVTTDYGFFCSLTLPSVPNLSYLLCGASLIHPQWVLTAGHCVIDQMTNQPQTNMDAVLAPYIPMSGTSYKRIQSSKIYLHKDYDINGQGNDIALIKLKTPMPATATIVDLPPHGNNALTANGATCHIVGFGIYDINAPWNQPDTLQYAQIQIIDNNTCNSLYPGSIEPGMLCAGMLTGPEKGGAAGDSGGPLFVKTASGPVQVGLVSWGGGSWSTNTAPGVFTRISAYRNWIDSVMNADSGVSVDRLAENKAELVRTESSIVVKLEDIAEHDLAYIIYNYEGRAISKGNWPKGKSQYTADASQLHQSLYFISITDNRNYRFTGKLPILR